MGVVLALPGVRPAVTVLAAGYFLYLAYRIATAPPLSDTIPPPAAEIFTGLADTAARVERLVVELFGFYARLPLLERVRCDKHLMPVLRRFINEERQNRRALFEIALGSGATPQQVDVAIALTDPAVHSALTQAGWSTDDAAREIARTLTLALAHPPY